MQKVIAFLVTVGKVQMLLRVRFARQKIKQDYESWKGKHVYLKWNGNHFAGGRNKTMAAVYTFIRQNYLYVMRCPTFMHLRICFSKLSASSGANTVQLHKGSLLHDKIILQNYTSISHRLNQLR